VTAGIVDALLALAVLACWLGAAGFLRLRSAYDRLHCVTFVNAAAGAAILGAALAADGLSARVGKIAVLVALSLGVGAALAHASGRALRRRAQAQ
jgi:multicomponent Na+:H+ antiporter subunit G